ncbi:MAG: polyribonucleotide nucleotidyltransferase [Parachlamydiales bacterium]
MQEHEKRVTIGDTELLFKSGKIARQAGGAVWLQQGETIVFATACAEHKPGDVDFLPLRVDYQEKFSSRGKTLGGFIKREGRPSERETLICRLIDRPIRPLFPDGYRNETQILAYVWSYDEQHQTDVMAICAASAALTLSEIPISKPLGAVRVGMIGGRLALNPTSKEMESSTLDLVVAGTQDAILMIEGYCDFLTEDQVIEALTFGHEAIQKICTALGEWRKEIGKPKMETTLKVTPQRTLKAVRDLAAAPLAEALRVIEKKVREEKTAAVKAAMLEKLLPGGVEGEHTLADIGSAFKQLSSDLMRQMVVKEGKRCDGRSTTDIRPIFIEQAILPRTHGSSLFTRGETQAVAVCTLGGETMAQRYETLEEEGKRRFYLQYSFPPFSVGEVGRVGAPGRREVGHGKLAERALQILIPPKEKFPYVIRLESNITESNGSSSMASVCGGCLAMMDAGVPIKRPVSGIAMGLILEKDSHTILSDILGVEDALGDMDFKVTGDAEGITAFQMDIKVEGITPQIMRAALEQAKAGRRHILSKMLEACPAPRAEMVAHAPRIETIQIKPSKIGAVIGPGGSMIRSITEQTGVEVDIDDSGLISLAGPSAEKMEAALAMIASVTAEIEVGKVYRGKVKAVKDFGAFVEVLPGKEGLCHISELAETRIDDIYAHIKEGETLDVKVLDINERGQIKLSRKAVGAA